MKGLFTFLLLSLASAVSVMPFPHLQSPSTPDIVQTKRQSVSVMGDGDQNYYSLSDTIKEGRNILYAYNSFAALLSVQALPETYGASVTMDLLTNLTFTAVNTFNGSLIYMTAHHGRGFGYPQTTYTPASYQFLLNSQQLGSPIDVDAPDAFSFLSRSNPRVAANGTVYGATIHLPSGNVGPYKSPEIVWTFYLGGQSACSVPASASVAEKFLSCVA